jgi:uncharacterized delta-60 repeat protein
MQKHVMIGCSLALVAGSVFASPAGTLDTGFSGDGVVKTGFSPYNASAAAVLQQPDGKLVIAGYVDADVPSSSNKQLVLIRYNSSDGSRDTTFNGNGVLQVSFAQGIRAAALARQTDNKLVAAGWVRPNDGSAESIAIVRVKTDGSLDHSFNSDGVVTTSSIGNTPTHAYAVTTRSDGTILAAGDVAQSGTLNKDFVLLSYKSNGDLNNNFGDGGAVVTDISGGNDVARAIIKQTDGKIILLGGTEFNAAANSNFALVRYNSNGSIDNGFSGDGKITTKFRSNDYSVAYGGMQQKDGKIVVVGSSISVDGGDGDFAIARYLSDGTLDSSFNGSGKVLTDVTSGNDFATGVIQQWDGKLLVSGDSSDGSSILVRYNTNGSLDTSFGIGGVLVTNVGDPMQVNGMVLQADGQVVVAGNTFTSGNYVVALVRYLFDDDDGDGIVDSNDNCQYVSNADQANHDDDVFGDACDSDDDNDGVPDTQDAFPFDPTESVDTDGDGIGNNADPDDDNDGVPDVDDPFPLDPFLLDRVTGNKGDWSGYSVAIVGDVNGDNFDDILVGAPKTDVVLPGKIKKSADVGIVTLVAGNTLATLHVFNGIAQGDLFGSTVAALGDIIGGDGIPDYAIAAPKSDEIDSVTGKVLKKDRGAVYIFSGADCLTINAVCNPVFTLTGEDAGDNFGSAIAASGDAAGDFIVGAPKADVVDPVTSKTLKDAGAAYLYSSTGVLLKKFEGKAKGDYFGFSVAGGADLDHNGVVDVGGGAYPHDPKQNQKNKPRTDAGSVYVYSSAAPYSPVKQLDGAAKGDYFGYALASVNEGQDAYRDLAVGSPKADITVGSKKIIDAGSVAVFTDTSAAPLYNITAQTSQTGARFGSALAAVGDVNASGTESIAIGAPKMDVISLDGKKLTNAGYVVVRSAAQSGSTVFAINGKIAGSQAGFSVAGIGDFNNDNYNDVLIGAPYALFNNAAKSGTAEIFSGKEASIAGP